MRVSLNVNQASGCQPLKFASNKQKATNQNLLNSFGSTNNVEQKYDLACRIIALQKQQILALQAKNKK